MTCVGIYADVQILKEQMIKASRSENYHTNEEEDNEKVLRLVKQYKEFKMKNLPNFFFNPEKGTEQYGKW